MTRSHPQGRGEAVADAERRLPKLERQPAEQVLRTGRTRYLRGQKRAKAIFLLTCSKPKASNRAKRKKNKKRICDEWSKDKHRL